MKTTFKSTLIALFGAAALFSLQSCEKDSPSENRGEAIEDATDDAPAPIEEAGDAIKEATDN